MSDLLALQWEKEHVYGVQAHVTPAQVRVVNCFTIAKPADMDLSEPKQTGKWLKEQLDSLQIRADATLITLPRDAVVVKRLELPAVPDEELPVLVRFQAGAKSSLPIGDLALDFVPLPQREASQARQVVTAVVPRQMVEGLQAVCREAGLKLVTLGLAPICVLEVVSRNRLASGQMSEGTILVVARYADRAEISVADGGHILSSHAFRLAEGGPEQQQQAILTEVSRALISLNSGTKLQQAWILADPEYRGTLPTALGKRLTCEVQMTDPFVGVVWSNRDLARAASPALLAGPIGALLAKSMPLASSLDFLNPRQPPVKRDRRKAQVTMIAGAVAGLVLLFGGWYVQYLRQLSKIAEGYAKADRDITRFVTAGEPIRKSADLVEQWLSGDVFLLDELLELTQHMPPTDRIFLKSLGFDPPSAPYIAKIKAAGFARERNDVMRLDERAITERRRYEVMPNAIQPDKEYESYPWRFETEVLIKQVEPKTVAKSSQTASAAASTSAATTSPASKTETPSSADKKDTIEAGPSREAGAEKTSNPAAPSGGGPAAIPSKSEPAKAAPAGKDPSKSAEPTTAGVPDSRPASEAQPSAAGEATEDSAESSEDGP